MVKLNKEDDEYVLYNDDIDIEMGSDFQAKSIVKPDKDLSIPQYNQSDLDSELVEAENEESDEEDSEMNSTQMNLKVKNTRTRSTFSKNSSSFYLENEKLFVRNAQADTFYLVLRGKVTIISGKEGFELEVGSFTSIGSKALLEEDYRPDFSAKIVDEAKLLKITRAIYLEFLR